MRRLITIASVLMFIGVIGMLFSYFVLQETAASSGRYSEKRVITEAIDKVNVKMDNQFVTIQESDDNNTHIEIINAKNKDSVKTSVTSGELLIDGRQKGINVDFNFGLNHGPKVIIMLPNKTYERISVDIDTGEVKAAELNVKELTTHIDAGQIEFELIKGEHFEGTVDVGEIKVNQLDVKKVDFRVDTGSLSLAGLRPDVTIKGKVDVGETKLNYREQPQNTEFNLQKDMGHINLDNNISNLSGSGEHKVDIVVHVGTLEINVQ